MGLDKIHYIFLPFILFWRLLILEDKADWKKSIVITLQCFVCLMLYSNIIALILVFIILIIGELISCGS